MRRTDWTELPICILQAALGEQCQAHKLLYALRVGSNWQSMSRNANLGLEAHLGVRFHSSAFLLCFLLPNSDSCIAEYDYPPSKYSQ
jgi:hypothetical protein